MLTIKGPLVLLAFAATLVYGEPSCTPTEIHLTEGDVMTKSVDRFYQDGDIFYRTCAQLSSRTSIGWCPGTRDLSPRIQINLPHVTDVRSIVFQNIQADCTDPTRDFSDTGFMKTFDLQYVIAGDQEGTLITYAQNMEALSASASEHEVRMAEPLVTTTLQIIPKTDNIYPCFRFKLIGSKAESLCPAGFCMNGGSCAGKSYCLCRQGFFGERCNQTIQELEQQDYSFTQIVNNQIETPAATFDVIGDVTMDPPTSDRRRDSHHHGHHGHSCHIHSSHGHHSYLHHNSQHHHSSNHHSNSHHSSSSHHCLHGLSNHHSGFTTSMNVNLGHNHQGNCHFFSNGGHLPGHQGASLSYHNNQLHLHVSTGTHTWHASHQCTLTPNTNHQITTSWHPHTGCQLMLNNQLVATATKPTVNPCQTCQIKNMSLTLGSSSVTATGPSVNLNVNININVSLSNLVMYALSHLALTNLGVPGPYTPAPPTTPTPPTTTPTTTQVSATPPGQTTPVPTTPTTTQPTTTPKHGPLCYNYAHESKIGGSQNTIRCNYGEECALFHDKTGYTAKCLTKQLCDAGKRLAGAGQCWECCKSYLCNDHCAASTTQSCKDQPTCATLMSTGYDVCKDPQNALKLCPKTCNLCSGP